MDIIFQSWYLHPNAHPHRLIEQWKSTAQGQWAMQNADKLEYQQIDDVHSFGYQLTIRGHVAEGPQLTEYWLRWPL